MVFISDDPTKMDYDCYTSSQDSPWLALPYRAGPTLGERARKHFGAEGVPSAVVTRWAATKDEGKAYVQAMTRSTHA